MLPIAVLLFIGSPTYASWTETIRVIWRASRENSSLFGFEWAIPLLSACAAAVLACYVRSNKPLVQDSLNKVSRGAQLNR
jgi:hypothetical protein